MSGCCHGPLTALCPASWCSFRTQYDALTQPSSRAHPQSGDFCLRVPFFSSQQLMLAAHGKRLYSRGSETEGAKQEASVSVQALGLCLHRDSASSTIRAGDFTIRSGTETGQDAVMGHRRRPAMKFLPQSLHGIIASNGLKDSWTFSVLVGKKAARLYRH